MSVMQAWHCKSNEVNARRGKQTAIVFARLSPKVIRALFRAFRRMLARFALDHAAILLTWGKQYCFSHSALFDATRTLVHIGLMVSSYIRCDFYKSTNFVFIHQCKCSSESVARELLDMSHYLLCFDQIWASEGSAGRTFTPGFKIWYFAISVLVVKCFSLSLKLVKWNFTTVSPMKKFLLATPGKIHYCPPVKNPFGAYIWPHV